MRRHIYDDDFWYSFGLCYVKLATRLCYRRFHVSGWQRVPKEGSVILVSNHTNALMDPLVMLLAEGRKVVFMARADIFRKPFIRKVLTWLRILPIYRIRDGYGAVRDNDKAIAEAVEVLKHHTPLCLYPEGTHRTKHSLLRLGKGLFHIALDAHDAGAQPVYIVPVGIEYSNYFRFRADVEMQVGEPINVSQFAEDFSRATEETSPTKYEESISRAEEGKNSFGEGISADAKGKSQSDDANRARLMNALRDKLTTSLQGLFSWVPDDDDYEALWELAQLRTARFHPLSLREATVLNQREIKQLLNEREKAPEAMHMLFQKSLSFKDEREAKHISVGSTSWKHPLWRVIIRALGLFVTLPLMVTCAAVSLPVWLVATLLVQRAKDPAWSNTWRFAACLPLMPLIVVGVAIAAFCHLAWGWALALTLLSALSIPVVYDWMEQLQRLVSDWHWLRSPSLRAKLAALLQ